MALHLCVIRGEKNVTASGTPLQSRIGNKSRIIVDQICPSNLSQLSTGGEDEFGGRNGGTGLEEGKNVDQGVKKNKSPSPWT